MGEYWATRTGRWRKAMQAQETSSLAERLCKVIRADVAKCALPAGALLPTVDRVARELMIPSADVRDAYDRLLSEGVLARRDGDALYVPGGPGEPDPKVGEATQIRFEAALLRAVREAAARGLSSAEATGMFKAAALRIKEIERGEDYDD